MNAYVFLTGFLVFYFIPFNCPLIAQSDSGYLYGEVVLKSGKKYTGQIRIDDQDATWDNIFMAFKHDRPIKAILAKAEAQQPQNQDQAFSLNFMDLWKDKSPDLKFVFLCHYGDLLSLEAISAQKIRANLRNGKSVKLKIRSGSDLVRPVFVWEKNQDPIKLSWENIKSVHFNPMPPSFKPNGGPLIYGRILSTLGIYEGFITWDSEECLGKDIITGYLKNGNKVDMDFEDIASLKAQGSGSLITTHSGRKLFLNKHPDVSETNDGITIRNYNNGKIRINWENFISASFFPPPIEPVYYTSFCGPKKLYGTILTHDKASYYGQISFNLHRNLDIEFLIGSNNNYRYFIPFSKIKRLEPYNDRFTQIYMKDGTKQLIGIRSNKDAFDKGLIIKIGEEDTKYLPWNSVKIIELDD